MTTGILTNVSPVGSKTVHAWVTLERIQAEDLFGMKWREIATRLGITPRALRNYRAILKAEYEALCEGFETVIAPVSEKPERPISTILILKRALIAVGTTFVAIRSFLESLFKSSLDDSDTLGEGLEEIEEESLPVDRESMGILKESSEIPVDPAPKEPTCILHFCTKAKSYVHVNRMIEKCTGCGATFDEVYALLGDPIASNKICGGDRY